MYCSLTSSEPIPPKSPPSKPPKSPLNEDISGMDGIVNEPPEVDAESELSASVSLESVWV